MVSMFLRFSLALIVTSACIACSAEVDFASDVPAASDAAIDEDMVPGRLTAGEWRDLDNWSFWMALNQRMRGDDDFGQRWGFDTTGRQALAVVDADGAPVVDARVVLLGPGDEPLWEARTDNSGEAELFANLFSEGEEAVAVAVESGGVERIEPIDEEDRLEMTVSIESASSPVEVVDVMFVIDTTGSMGDELSYLQMKLADVIGAVRDEHDILVRTSVNFYRDEDEPYVVRSNPFSANLEEVVEELRRESAAGGGDEEEALDLALEDAIFAHQWSPSARSRILFLMLDAPPRRDIEVLDRLHAVAAEAARLGVRVIPIGASGVDLETEFLLRFLDVSTGGTYVFLTEESGFGQSTLSTVGDYEVEPLDELLERLISGSLR
jgi:hypothetical protein